MTRRRSRNTQPSSLRLCASAVIFTVCLAAYMFGGETPKRPEAGMLFQEAWYAEEGLRDLPGAIQIYDRIVREYPEERSFVARSLMRLGACYERLGQWARARDTYWQAYRDYLDEIHKLPEYLHQDVRIARKFDEAFSGEGADQKKMMDFVKDFLASEPLAAVYQRYNTWRGEAFRLRKADPVKAIATFRKTIALGMYLGRSDGGGLDAPGIMHDSAYLQSLIGDTYLEIEQFDQAIREFRRVHEDFPAERELAANCQMRIAEVYRAMDQVAEAIEVYSQLPVTYPDQKRPCAWAKLWTGDCFRELSDMKKANAQWEAVLDFPESEDTRLAQRAARWLLGKEPVPDHIDIRGSWANDALYFAALKYEMDGRAEKTIELLKKCVEQSDGNDWPAPLAKRLIEILEAAE